jgi:hypothetical protein
MELQLDVNSTFVRRRLTEILSGSVLVLRGCLDDRKTFNCLASKGKLRLRSQFVHLHSLEVTDTGTAFFSTTFTAQIHFHNFWPSSRGAFAPFFCDFPHVHSETREPKSWLKKKLISSAKRIFELHGRSFGRDSPAKKDFGRERVASGAFAYRNSADKPRNERLNLGKNRNLHKNCRGQARPNEEEMP